MGLRAIGVGFRLAVSGLGFRTLKGLGPRIHASSLEFGVWVQTMKGRMIQVSSLEFGVWSFRSSRGSGFRLAT